MTDADLIEAARVAASLCNAYDSPDRIEEVLRDCVKAYEGRPEVLRSVRHFMRLALRSVMRGSCYEKRSDFYFSPFYETHNCVTIKVRGFPNTVFAQDDGAMGVFNPLLREGKGSIIECEIGVNRFAVRGKAAALWLREPGWNSP